MTHYMELLMTNQPWNLIIYMAIPVILAETIAISELYLLFTGKDTGTVKTLSKVSGIIVGWYFLGIFINLLLTAVIPLTTSNGWRGIADVIAVGFYLLGLIPLFGIALLDMNLLYASASQRERNKLHAIFVGVFLVVAHIAMIFGMADPNMFMEKGDIEHMPGMSHP
ncbi:MAG: permease [Nitrosospira sp.]|nr:permease [Nitrosospira sp.]MBI0408594.1 permease [Nitrosospira sp.]